MFATAFYFALRDTLVANDLDQATRIAYQVCVVPLLSCGLYLRPIFGVIMVAMLTVKGGKPRHRVVTLSGQLIDTSGTMSGGGAKPARGGMSAKLSEEVTPAALRALEVALEENVASLEAHRERRGTLEKAVCIAPFIHIFYVFTC